MAGESIGHPIGAALVAQSRPRENPLTDDGNQMNPGDQVAPPKGNTPKTAISKKMPRRKRARQRDPKPKLSKRRNLQRRSDVFAEHTKRKKMSLEL